MYRSFSIKFVFTYEAFYSHTTSFQNLSPFPFLLSKVHERKPCLTKNEDQVYNDELIK